MPGLRPERILVLTQGSKGPVLESKGLKMHQTQEKIILINNIQFIQYTVLNLKPLK